MITLMLVDDRPAVRRGLRMRLEMEPDVIVVGEAADGRRAVERAATLRPDVVVMDIEMPGLDGLSATDALRRASPESAVVILTLYDSEEARTRARAAGAAAFVAKHEAGDSLIPAIRGAADWRSAPA